MPATNHQSLPQTFTKKAADLTDYEKAELARKFSEKFKPAIEKWFKAYEGRVPFQLENVTLDSFHSRLGTHMYTFMIGTTTFTIQDSKDANGLAKVSYLMTREAAKQLNQLPAGGVVPDLTLPITRDEVIRMVKADSGMEFRPNEIVIKPTAAACALNGGAFVEVGKPGNGVYKSFADSRLSLVFGSDGNLINYERNPFF